MGYGVREGGRVTRGLFDICILASDSNSSSSSYGMLASIEGTEGARGKVWGCWVCGTAAGGSSINNKNSAAVAQNVRKCTKSRQ